LATLCAVKGYSSALYTDPESCKKKKKQPGRGLFAG